MKKFVTGAYREGIEIVEVERETDSSVWVKGSGGKIERRNKIAGSDRYNDTWDDAHSFLLEQAISNFKYALRKLAICKSDLEAIQQMHKPEGI